MTVQQLVKAARRGNFSKVEQLVQQGVDINGKGVDGHTALIWASACGRTEIAIFLADQPDIDWNAAGSHNQTALILAATYNHIAIVQHLLAKPGIHVNAPNKCGWTALHHVSFYGNTQIVQLLLDHPDTNITCQTNNGKTALDLAVQYNHTETIGILEQHIQDTDTNGLTNQETQLLLAAKHGQVEKVKDLLTQFPNINLNACSSTTRQSALHLAAKYGKLNVVRLLLDNLAVDVNLKDTNDKTALDYAKERGHSQVKECIQGTVGLTLPAARSYFHSVLSGSIDKVQHFLKCADSDFNLNVQNENGESALHLAAKNGHQTVVELLVNHAHVSFDICDKKGWTALHWASHLTSLKLVKALLDAQDADIQVKTKDGNTALDLAPNGSNVQVYLAENGGKKCPLLSKEEQFLQAVKNGELEAVKHIVESHHGNFNTRFSYHDRLTALHWAGRRSNLELLQYLVDNTNASLNAIDRKGRTVLHEACRWASNTDIVEFLLSRMTMHDINIQDHQSRTALQVAMSLDNKEITKLLLQSDKVYPDSLLHWALKCGIVDFVELLLASPNIDMTRLNENGQTVLHVAVATGNVALVEKLLEHSWDTIDIHEKDDENQTALDVAMKLPDTDQLSMKMNVCIKAFEYMKKQDLLSWNQHQMIVKGLKRKHAVFTSGNDCVLSEQAAKSCMGVTQSASSTKEIRNNT